MSRVVKCHVCETGIRDNILTLTVEREGDKIKQHFCSYKCLLARVLDAIETKKVMDERFFYGSEPREE